MSGALETLRFAHRNCRRDAQLLDGRDYNEDRDNEYDAALEALVSEAETLRTALEAARRELARASDVRVNRTKIIGNVDLILAAALSGERT